MMSHDESQASRLQRGMLYKRVQETCIEALAVSGSTAGHSARDAGLDRGSCFLRGPLQRWFQQTLSRARSLDDAVAETDPRGLKRSASGPAEDVERGPPSAPFSSIPEVPGGQPQQAPPQLPEESRQPPEGPDLAGPSLPPQLREESRQPPEGPSASSTTSTARAPFEALVLDNEQLESLSGDSWSHPLLQVKHKLSCTGAFAWTTWSTTLARGMGAGA